MSYPIAIKIPGTFLTNDLLKIYFDKNSLLNDRTIIVESKDSLPWYNQAWGLFFEQTWAPIGIYENGVEKRIFIHIEQLANEAPEYEIKAWAKAGKLAKEILKLATPTQKGVTGSLEASAPKQEAKPYSEQPKLPKNTNKYASLPEYVNAHRKEWEEAFKKDPTLRIIKDFTPFQKPNPTRRNQSLYIIKDKKNPEKIRIFINAGKLSKGSFKKVFRLKNIEIDEIKVLSKASQKDSDLTEAEAMQLFLEEKTILQSTNTEKIGSKEYMIMKFCDLGDLDNYLNTGKLTLTLNEQVQLIQDLLKAMLKMHQKGYAHQDIKPANIFLYQNKQGQIRAKLADLGSMAKLNKTSIVGSPLYWSPEKFLREGLPEEGSKTADIFALGLTFYQLIHQLQYHLFVDDYESWFYQDCIELHYRIKKVYQEQCSNPKNLIEKLIFGMIHPDPKKRLTAEQAYELARLEDFGTS